ncbi:hypothetical protein ACFVWC_14110 [Bacillus mycoides]|uniref:hypothetical protein n=1 Tax=Bacillus mycoides TaxID=1405 RepID=UPI0036E5A11E
MGNEMMERVDQLSRLYSQLLLGLVKNRIKNKKERLFCTNKRAILSLDKQNGNDFKER